MSCVRVPQVSVSNQRQRQRSVLPVFLRCCCCVYVRAHNFFDAGVLAGVLTVPFILGTVLEQSDVSLDAVALLIKLACTILLPLLIGKVCHTCFDVFWI